MLQNKSRIGMPCRAVDGEDLRQQLNDCYTDLPHFPHRWTSASDCDGRPLNDGSNCRSKADQDNNNAMALLLEDNVTLVQMQPVYRCGYGAPLLARWGNATDGGPQAFPNLTSILGDGTYGAQHSRCRHRQSSCHWHPLPSSKIETPTRNERGVQHQI